MLSRYVSCLLAGVLLVGVLAACGQTSATQPDPTVPSSEAMPVPPPTEDLLKLRANAWQWTGYDDGSGVQPVDNPAAYQATFNTDATVAVKADCNSAAGSYQLNEINGNALTIELGPTTAAACGENSRGSEFLVLLAAATGARFEEGNLLIDVSTEGGSGTMSFAPAQ